MKFCILLVELFESYDDARTCERQILRPSFNLNACYTPHRDFLRFRNANISWKAEVILDALVLL
jgi:hypothetical protein